MMWGNYDEFSWWWFVIMPLGMLGFWVLVAWVIVTLVRGDRPTATSDPEHVLADRYARGDIDAVEYHRRVDDLRQTASPRVS